jgi:uncharacterized caspase-like protein
MPFMALKDSLATRHLPRRRLLQAAAASLTLPALARADFRLDPNQPRTRYTALLIGNAAYAAPMRLQGPPADTERMGTALRALGYEVTTVLNAAQRPLRDALNTFAAQAAESHVALLYYSGLVAADVGDGGLLLPVDLPAPTSGTLDAACDAGPSVADALAMVARAANGVLILDTCHTSEQGSAVPRKGCPATGLAGLATLLRQNVALAIASDGLAEDSPTGSPYTQALAQELGRKGQTFNRLFDDAAVTMARQTRARKAGNPVSVNTLQRAVPVAKG